MGTYFRDAGEEGEPREVMTQAGVVPTEDSEADMMFEGQRTDDDLYERGLEKLEV